MDDRIFLQFLESVDQSVGYIVGISTFPFVLPLALYFYHLLVLPDSQRWIEFISAVIIALYILDAEIKVRVGGDVIGYVQVIFGIGMEVAEVPGTIEQLLVIFYTNLVAQQVDQVAVYLFSSVAFVREVMVPRFLVAGYRIVAGMVRDIVQISFANTDHQPVEGWEPVEYLS